MGCLGVKLASVTIATVTSTVGCCVGRDSEIRCFPVRTGRRLRLTCLCLSGTRARGRVEDTLMRVRGSTLGVFSSKFSSTMTGNAAGTVGCGGLYCRVSLLRGGLGSTCRLMGC